MCVIGWGTTSFGGPISDVLQKVQLDVVPQNKCIASFSKTAESGKQFCTYTQGKDTCQVLICICFKKSNNIKLSF